MQLPEISIRRPVFASVLSLIITLAGGIAVFTLPIAQYPEIAPPTVQVTCSYPGANAQVVVELDHPKAAASGWVKRLHEYTVPRHAIATVPAPATNQRFLLMT